MAVYETARERRERAAWIARRLREKAAAAAKPVRQACSFCGDEAAGAESWHPEDGVELVACRSCRREMEEN